VRPAAVTQASTFARPACVTAGRGARQVDGGGSAGGVDAGSGRSRQPAAARRARATPGAARTRTYFANRDMALSPTVGCAGYQAPHSGRPLVMGSTALQIYFRSSGRRSSPRRWSRWSRFGVYRKTSGPPQAGRSRITLDRLAAGQGDRIGWYAVLVAGQVAQQARIQPTTVNRHAHRASVWYSG